MCRQSCPLVSLVLSGLCFASGCSRDAAPPIQTPAVSPAAGDASNGGGPPDAGEPQTAATAETQVGTPAADETPQPAATPDPGDSSATGAATAEMETYVERNGEEVYPAADAQLDVAVYLAEFKADSKQFKEKYGDKIVEVTGTLDSYYSSKENVVAHLETESRNNLRFELSQDRPWTICPPGSRVTIRGRTSGLGYMFKAYIVSHEPPEVVELDAEEAAKSFAEDEEGFVETLKDKVLLVKGKLREQVDEETMSTYHLGTADNEIRLVMGGMYRHPIPWNPPPGDDVAAYCQYSVWTRPGRLAFDQIHPLAPLAEYPPLPKAREQTIDGRSLTVRPFMAELLGRWACENPRALSLAFQTAVSSAYLLVTGEVASVEHVELPFRKAVRIRLVDGQDCGVYYDVDEEAAAERGVQVGDQVTMYGTCRPEDNGVILPRAEFVKE